MKERTKSISFILALALLTLTAFAQAAGNPRLYLSVPKLDLGVGQEMTVEVRVEDAPEIYGVDVRLSFDATMLEVVDANSDREGIQIQPGDFIEPEQAFILEQQADNQAGTIHYALTLLKPAPPAEGDGLLLQITFRAKADGQTTIHFEDQLFGTLASERIIPLVEDSQISIIPSTTDVALETLTVDNAPAPTPTSVFAIHESPAVAALPTLQKETELFDWLFTGTVLVILCACILLIVVLLRGMRGRQS